MEISLHGAQTSSEANPDPQPMCTTGESGSGVLHLVTKTKKQWSQVPNQNVILEEGGFLTLRLYKIYV